MWCGDPLVTHTTREGIMMDAKFSADIRSWSGIKCCICSIVY
jgi:hypothetical protein